MGVWVCIVEGDGDKEAVPLLLRRLVHGKFQRYETRFEAINAKGRGNLTDEEKFARFLNLALTKRDLAAILVVLDAETDCPKVLAQTLANWARQRNPRVSVAIVVANRYFEAWLLAGHCLHTNPETVAPSDAKRKLAQKIRRAAYRETMDQGRLTAQMTVWKAYRRCRSFRRLVHAVAQLIQEVQNGQTVVTP